MNIFSDNNMVLTITARCTTNDGATRQANTTVTLEISQSLPTGTPMTNSQLEELCYHGNSGTFYVEENRSDVVIGTVNRCSGGSGITKTYKVNKRKSCPVSQQAHDVKSQNDVVWMSMRRNYVASTSIQRHFNVVCLLGYISINQ